MDIANIIDIFIQIITSSTIVYVTLATILGVIFGAIPGLTATLAVVILIPFTYGLDQTTGISTLIGAYIGGVSGGVVAAILIGMPGTPSSITTAFDGFPLAKMGLARKALGYAALSNLIGSLFSLVLLITVAPQLARVSLALTHYEYAAIMLFAFIIVSGLSGELYKGIIVSVLGLSLATFGFDPINATVRNPLEIPFLRNGIVAVPALIGLFVIARVFIEMNQTESDRIIPPDKKGSRIIPPFKEAFKYRVNFLRSSAIGSIIGVIPGIGQSLASFVAYDQAKKADKNPESFGKGNIQGVISSEAANNAVIGGALVPLLVLGIPGDTVTSVLLGGLRIQGLQPGPLMFRDEMDFIIGLFVSFFIAVIAMYLFIVTIGARIFPKVLSIKKAYLLPIVVVMSIAGSYNIGYRVEDVWVMALFGILGYILIKNSFPILPLVITILLGSDLERYLRRGLIESGGSFTPFFTRPLSLTIIILIVITVIAIVLKNKKDKRKAGEV